MMRLPQFTLRNFLIATHDALATGAALFAVSICASKATCSPIACRLLLRILPISSCSASSLLRLEPDHDEMGAHFAADAAEHPARGDDPDARARGARLLFRRANTHGKPVATERAGRVLHRQDHHHPLLCFSRCSSGARCGSPTGISATRARGIMPKAENASPALLVGRAAERRDLPARHRKAGLSKRIWPVGVRRRPGGSPGSDPQRPGAGAIDDFEDVVRDFEARGKPIARIRDGAVGVRAGIEAQQVLMRARRLGMIVSRLPSSKRERNAAADPVAVEDLLLRPMKSSTTRGSRPW